MNVPAEIKRHSSRPTELRAQIQKFPRNQWYVAAGRPEIGRSLLGREILNEQVLLYRTEDGTAVALSNWCPHRGFRLSDSKLIGDTVQCGYHGMSFNSAGACTHIPSQRVITPQMSVRSFPLVEKSCFAWIWMGDPSKANPALIPDTSTMEETLTGSYVNRALFNCNAQLLIENIADVSHSSFLHPGLLDNAGDAEFMKTPLQVDIQGNVVVATQDFGDFNVGDNLAPMLGVPAGTVVHRLRIAREFLPGLHTSVDIYSDREDRTKVRFCRLILGGVTPANDRSCHHFSGLYSTSPDANSNFFAAGQLAVQQDMMALDFSQRAYEEGGSHFKEVSIRADEAALATRRIIAAMSAAEGV